MTTPDAADVRRLAITFATVIREWTTPAEFARIKAANVGYGADICATHDVMDANMAMAEAFKRALGRECTLACDVEEGTASAGDDDRDIDLWNAAWDMAKREWLTDGCADIPLESF